MKRLYEYNPDTWYDKDKHKRALFWSQDEHLVSDNEALKILNDKLIGPDYSETNLGNREYYFDGKRVGSIKYAHSLIDMIHNNGFSEITAESLLSLPSELIIDMGNFPENNTIMRECKEKSRINASGGSFTTGFMLEYADYYAQLTDDVHLLPEIKEHMLSNNRNYYMHEINTVGRNVKIDLYGLRETQLHYFNQDTQQSETYHMMGSSESASIIRTSRIPDDIFMKMSGFEKGDDRLTYDRYEIYKEFPAYNETIKKEQSEKSDKVTEKESYEQLNLFDYDDLNDENTMTK